MVKEIVTYIFLSHLYFSLFLWTKNNFHRDVHLCPRACLSFSVPRAGCLWLIGRKQTDNVSWSGQSKREHCEPSPSFLSCKTLNSLKNSLLGPLLPFLHIYYFWTLSNHPYQKKSIFWYCGSPCTLNLLWLPMYDCKIGSGVNLFPYTWSTGVVHTLVVQHRTIWCYKRAPCTELEKVRTIG